MGFLSGKTLLEASVGLNQHEKELPCLQGCSLRKEDSR